MSEEDIEKNSDIQMKNIRREFADLNGVERHEVVYSGMENLDNSFKNLDISDPGLVFDQSSCTLSKRNEFDDETLNEIIHSSSIPRQIPTRFYPFSPDDSLALIGQQLLRHLMSESVSRETSGNSTDGGKIDAKEITSEIHDYWPLLSKEGQAQIVGKVNHILEKFNKKSMDEDMRKLENSGRSYYVRTSQSFRKKCKEVLSELEEEDSQRTLDYWTNDD
ncbi:hypothetical protein ACYJ1Y_12835 [Natrialbaceae archaeon A-gly3]